MIEIRTANHRQQRRGQPFVLGVREHGRARRRHPNPGSVEHARLVGRREPRVARQELEQVGGVCRCVDPADARVDAPEVTLIAQIGERSVEQPAVACVIQRRVLQFECRKQRQIECRERSQQHAVRAGLADPRAEAGRKRRHERASLDRCQQPAAVNARRNDCVSDVVAPDRVGRAEQGNHLVDQRERGLARGHDAVLGEREPESLAATLGPQRPRRHGGDSGQCDDERDALHRAPACPICCEVDHGQRGSHLPAQAGNRRVAEADATPKPRGVGLLYMSTAGGCPGQRQPSELILILEAGANDACALAAIGQ